MRPIATYIYLHVEIQTIILVYKDYMVPVQQVGTSASSCQPGSVDCCAARVVLLPRARCILASGVTPEDSKAIRFILEEDSQRKDDTPLVVFTPEIADKRVGDVLTDAPMIALLQVT